MSERFMLLEQKVRCCDLCGEPIKSRCPEYQTASLILYSENPLDQCKYDNAVLRQFEIMWNDLIRPPYIPKKIKTYDFHTDCLIKLVESNLYCYEDGKDE